MNLLISFLFAALLAQQTQTPIPTPPAAGSPQRPEPTGAAPARYMIGPQDLLKITVFDEAELTNSYRVDGDGFITFPYIGRVMASGMTLQELQDRIRTLLSAGFIRNPQVRAEIGEFKSQSVLVSGEVRQPGKITMTGAMTLLEALAAAGSATPSASSELTIAHPRRPGNTGDSEVVRVNWKDLQLGKGTDVGLQDGDLINVPKAQTFFITGQVHNGGPYVLEPGTTIQQAIAMAGGLSERGSDRGITVTRLVNGKSTDVKVTLEDKVQPNDTITIRNRFF
jgi:polysaccharide export outer membrane protein